MDIREFIKNNIVILDGAMGTMLQKAGLPAGCLTESWNLSCPDEVTAVHRAYFDAGANVVCTNTFGVNLLKYDLETAEKLVSAAVSSAKAAKDSSKGKAEKFISLDIGPTGRLLAPFGDLDFSDAVEMFSTLARLGEKYGVDMITVETMNDSYETKAALLGVKEATDLPVFVTNAYGEDGKLLTGATPAAMVAMLEGLGADAIGANCSLGPDKLYGVIGELLKEASVPVILKPNAGLPTTLGDETVYDISPDAFANSLKAEALRGVAALGGCCGTTPEYIKLLSKKCADVKRVPTTEKNKTVISSYAKTLTFGTSPVLIGERINPTGKKLLKEALRSGDMNYILTEAINEEEHGAHALDVNVGLADIDETEMLCRAVTGIQSVTSLPLQIDTSNPVAMEKALRLYNGKPLINSVNGTEESMKSVFPLQKKYGGVAVALTLDEKGIPADAEGRAEIAERILREAEKYGIKKKDIIFDTLTLTVSADKDAAKVTLEALTEVQKRTGCHTSLGVSNVSFGLPARPAVDSAFFLCALERGLSAAIMNPLSDEMMKTYRAYLLLHGLDENCAGYISYMSDKTEAAKPIDCEKNAPGIGRCIIKGLADAAGKATRSELTKRDGTDIIENEIIPALDTVGTDYENGKVYLPELLMSAEAAKASFDVIKSAEKKENGATKCTVILATVKGDIHDIGKNIVRLMLENYGFDVRDLGRDVPPEQIVSETLKTGAPLVGLSALMTTTVPSMEKTVKMLKEAAPGVKIAVGGAVLNAETAKLIGADKYCRDAMDTVRFADSVNTAVKRK